MFYCTKAQLHVSAIKVGHLQVVQVSIGYTNVSGVYRMWGVRYCLLISYLVQPEDGQL